MNTVTRKGDGTTQDFYFEFPFFMKSDIVIEVNSAPAVKYNLIPTSGGQNADYKYIGGRVHFSKAPRQDDIIKIYRKLPPKRFTDYQATSLYEPEILNQDLNYLLEMIKDTQAALAESMSGTSGGPDLSALTSALERIGEITESLNILTTRVDSLEITELPDKLEELTQLAATLDNVSAALANLSATMDAHASDLLLLNTRCTQIEDQIENIPTQGAGGGIAVPDYNNAINITDKTYTATSPCFVMCDAWNSSVYVNDVKIAYGASTINVQILLNTGDQIKGYSVPLHVFPIIMCEA